MYLGPLDSGEKRGFRFTHLADFLDQITATQQR